MLFLLFIASLFLFKHLFKFNKTKLANILSFYSFFITLIQGILIQLIFKTNDYVYMFFMSVISYWTMRYFYDVYLSIHVNEKHYFTPRISVFILFVLGLILLGLDLDISIINISLIGILVLSFIASKISLETAVLYSFLLLSVMLAKQGYTEELLLFFCGSIVVFLLSNTSKVTLFFTYVGGVLFFIYNFNLSYLLSINYCAAMLCYLFIPLKFIRSFSKMCFGSKEYIEKMNYDNKKINREIANKIIKMEEVFSACTSKINIKSRIKKNDKELLLEEINIFDNLMKRFAREVKENYDASIQGKLEKEIYKYGYDLLYLDVKENIFKDKIININIRCDKKEVHKIIIPIINKIMKQNYEVINIKNNEIFDFYEIKLKQSKKQVNFNFGVSQRAKDAKVCGDSYLIYENEFKYIFAISDGMGIGEEAKSKSKKMLDLLKKFLDIGFEEQQAIKSINYILKNETSKESYATLDLLVYDKIKNTFHFSKNGANSSFLLNKQGVNLIDGNDFV